MQGRLSENPFQIGNLQHSKTEPRGPQRICGFENTQCILEIPFALGIQRELGTLKYEALVTTEGAGVPTALKSSGSLLVRGNSLSTFSQLTRPPGIYVVGVSFKAPRFRLRTPFHWGAWGMFPFQEDILKFQK